MKDIHYGSIAFDNEDSRYGGSHFTAVRDAMFANPYQPIWGAKDTADFSTSAHQRLAHYR